ncbi:MAG: CRTAC1 family protein [Lysobacterales bacterium]
MIETLVSLLIVASTQNLSDVGAALGLDFVHRTGASGDFYFPEITGAGAALLDWDGDGDLDLYLVQSGKIDGEVYGEEDQVFLNQLPTEQLKKLTLSGASGYGMGIAVADVNNDGREDFYLTNLGPNQLWLNQGNGNYLRSKNSLTEGDSWSTSATFFDFDQDGWLDLYVVNYVEFSLSENPRCYSPTTRRDYCGPSGFEPQGDKLYRNLGDGRFADVTETVLKGYVPGPGLGVVARDFNNDGWQDLFVANDGAHNHLWVNGGGSSFVDEGLLSGVAVNGRGISEASMGVAAADFDEDGDQDLFLTHLMTETSTLYENLGDLQFRDVTQKAGLASSTRAYTGWGAGWVDFNHDGGLDLFSVNGAVRTQEAQLAAGSQYPFGQQNQLFLSDGRGRFERSDDVSSSFFGELSARGAAFGDVDNDGSADLLIANGNGPAQLFTGRAPSEPWLGLDLKLSSGATAIGASVVVQLKSGRKFHRVVHRDGSYASSNDPRLRFHIGGEQLSGLTIVWPGNTQVQYPELETGRYHILMEPAGE